MPLWPEVSQASLDAGQAAGRRDTHAHAGFCLQNLFMLCRQPTACTLHGCQAPYAACHRTISIPLVGPPCALNACCTTTSRVIRAPPSLALTAPITPFTPLPAITSQEVKAQPGHRTSHRDHQDERFSYVVIRCEAVTSELGPSPGDKLQCVEHLMLRALYTVCCV